MTLTRLRPQVILATAGAVLLVTFIFFKSQGENLERHDEIIGTLRLLKQEEININQNILKLRFGLLANYDELSRSQNQLQGLFKKIKMGRTAIFQQGSGEIDESIKGYENLIKQKQDFADEFNSENTTLQNSLHFFPHAMGQAMGRMAGNPTLQESLNRLYEILMVYQLLGDAERESETRVLLSRLQQNQEAGVGQKDLETVLAHAKILLNGKKTTDEAIAKILALPAIEGIDRISHDYDVLYSANVRESNLYKLVLYVICLGMGVYVSYILIKLKNMAGALHRANMLLERRVQERTAELAQTVDQLKSEINTRKKLEGVMLQSEKMAAVGQLAAGVAHEINNPLGVILGFSQALAKQIKAGDPFEMAVRSIEREALRCKALVQDLLTFSRTGNVDKERVDMNQAIESALSLVLAQAKVKNVEIEKELSLDIPSLLINKNQLQQIIINLSNNAIDAMPQGGKIFIKAQRIEKNGKIWTQLSMKDTGTGIPLESQPKIFNPFFTTKEIGKGTGLGLSLVYEIVRNHEGEIRFETEMGKGTTFHILFPPA